MGYAEARTYTKVAPPTTVHITVTNINFVNHTYSVSVPDAPTPTLRATWGQLKTIYR